ncbi:MAG: hypothetical protein WAN65_05820 [Candidatus Sulfotelmatobacter sp.]
MPKIEKPGSGQKVTYSRADAIQLLIALEAELLGLPPKFAASFSESVMESHAKKADAAAQNRAHYFLAIDPTFSFNVNDTAVFVSGSNKNLPEVDKSTHRRTIINLAMSIALLDYGLNKATGKARFSSIERG